MTYFEEILENYMDVFEYGFDPDQLGAMATFYLI